MTSHHVRAGAVVDPRTVSACVYVGGPCCAPSGASDSGRGASASAARRSARALDEAAVGDMVYNRLEEPREEADVAYGTCTLGRLGAGSKPRTGVASRPY